MKSNLLGLALTSLLPVALLSGCADSQFGAFGSSILSSTGLVSGSQADALVKAGQSVAKGVQSLSDEEEYYLGRGVAATVLSKYRPYRQAELTAYVNKVAAVLVAVSDRPETFGGYHVLLLDTSEVNAVSAPGGFIFLSTGFLKLVPSEEALAAVLAHEVGHIVKGHGLKAISEANLSQAVLLLGKEAAASQTGGIVQGLTSTFGDSITDIAGTLLTKGYSRSQEYESDAYAAELLKRAGYNQGGVLDMLTALEKAGGGKGGWNSTHPEAADRLEEQEDLKADPVGAGQQARDRRFGLIKQKLG